MRMNDFKTHRGFTLLELMVSMALGLVVMGAMASLFRMGMSSTFLVAQRAETQQNMRAAIELIGKDVSMAGAGLPTGGIQLPVGGTQVRFGCDQTGICYPTSNLFPANHMFGIIPGFTGGVQGNALIAAATTRRNDAITVIYADYNFPLWEYDIAFPAPKDGTSITLTPNPTFVPAPPALNSAGGIQVGDLIMLSNSSTAVGEVTNVTATAITFSNLDALNMNQSGATGNNIASIANGAPTIAYRLSAVTYYLSVPAAGQLPRLMRQVNGQFPVPVADDIINLQFAYDVSNPGGTDPNQPNPLGVAESPNLIQKVNVWVMGQSMTQDGNHAQSMYLATSVSARNMSFRDRYK